MSKSPSTSSSSYTTGQVTYLNRKKGYGFISYSIDQPPESRKDVFVHATKLSPYYREGPNYLCRGEYFEFRVESGEKGDSAVDVTGVNGGKLMMDFRRRENGESRNRSRGRRLPTTDTSEVDNTLSQLEGTS